MRSLFSSEEHGGSTRKQPDPSRRDPPTHC
jgi:hypothetical protein